MSKADFLVNVMMLLPGGIILLWLPGRGRRVSVGASCWGAGGQEGWPCLLRYQLIDTQGRIHTAHFYNPEPVSIATPSRLTFNYLKTRICMCLASTHNTTQSLLPTSKSAYIAIVVLIHIVGSSYIVSHSITQSTVDCNLKGPKQVSQGP